MSDIPSQTRWLLIAANAFASIFIAFGVNAIFRPANGLSFFEFPHAAPITAASSKEAKAAAQQDAKVIDALMAIYGVRDIFMGVAIYAATYFSSANDRSVLGYILIATSAVAFADGVICAAHKTGAEWNHWGYAPIIAGVGATLLGVFDPK